MSGKAAEFARQREREAYEKTQAVQLPPTDPIRRAKYLDGVPAPLDTGAPNGTAGKVLGAGESQVSGGADAPETPRRMPEVQPTVAKESRPAKMEDAPGLSSAEAEAAAGAGPDEKPKTTRRTVKKAAGAAE